MTKTVTMFSNPGAELNARAERRIATKGGTYQEAVHAVLAVATGRSLCATGCVCDHNGNETRGAGARGAGYRQ